MICGNCHSENPEGNRFCGNCGHGLAASCSNCGAENPPGQKFCGQCGTSLAEQAAPPVAASTTERRFVSVLFADLTGYTSFAEGRDSEDTRRFLEKYFDRSREIIESFGGLVEKFIGDAVMAVWGAEVAHEDDAERAVRAGFELADFISKLAADEGAPDLALRVGVNTGEAAVGPGRDHMGFVTGDLVNTASRLESSAEPGTVLVGETTRNAAAKAIAFEPVGALDLKNKSVPVPAWKALRVLSELGGRGKAETLEPPFVGRAEELRLLKDLLATVGRDSKTRLVSIVGEAGIGKSRLMWEFLKYVDGLVGNTYWHEGRSPSYGDGVTFFAVAEMIRRRAGIMETDPDDEATRKLDEALETYVADASDRAWIRPRVRAVLGIGEAPSGDRAELEAAVRAFFEGVATQGTTVLVFEDLHWADAATLDFVDELTDWWRNQPILIIALARPDLLEKRPAWGTGRQGVISSTLGILNDSEMTQVVRGVVPELPGPAVETIVRRAAGVPLYAVELLRSLIAQGAIEAADGSYRVVADISDIAVPESLHAVIGARLDRLEPEERSLIQDAAALGQSFSIEGLTVITGADAEGLEHRLQQLSRRELIEPVRDPRSPERGQYRFLQGLIREVALSRMSRETRRTRHLAVAEHMERQKDPEIAVVVASHYLQALEATPEGPEHDRIKTKALGSVGAAAHRAADLSAWEQVVSIAAKGIELTESDEERATFWEHLLEGYQYAPDRELAEKYGQMALQYHRDIGDERSEWRLMRKLGFLHVLTGQRERAVNLLAPLVESQDDFKADPELAKAATVYCRALMLQALDAGDKLDRAIQATEHFELKPYVLDGLITKASFSDKEGRLTEAQFLLEGAIRMSDEMDLTLEAARARNNLSYIISYIDNALAEKVSLDALDLARRSGNRPLIHWHLTQTGFFYSLTGRIAEMEAINADPMWEGAGDDILAGRRFFESVSALWAGDYSRARDLHREAVDLIDKSDPQAMDWVRAGELLQALFAGQPALVAGALAEFQGKVWSEVYAASLPIWLTAVLLGDPTTVGHLHDFLASYRPRFWQSANYLAALIELESDPDAALARITELTRIASEERDYVSVQAYLIGASVFLPKDDPRRDDYLERAGQFATDHGFQGFLDLIDRHVG